MTKSRTNNGGPRLLVSVRSAEEAEAALVGGADWIDVKEPDRGALGAADGETVAAIVRQVAGRVPVSMAVGELVECFHDGRMTVPLDVPEGIELFKAGLAGCGRLENWAILWRQAVEATSVATRPVAVVYADWRAADAPPPEQVLDAAVALDCPAVLVDTWGKSAGRLPDYFSAEELLNFSHSVRRKQMMLVLAGSITEEELPVAVAAEPDLIAVRGAVCDAGRSGHVVAGRVASLRQAIQKTADNHGAEHIMAVKFS